MKIIFLLYENNIQKRDIVSKINFDAFNMLTYHETGDSTKIFT